ncbi:hypothetical protein [Rhodopirellula sp. MGV]|uniref:hypothetical protein n=1 Tax=Rhodopirellula sp. MGV TaxID=2023130 RepID=UPI000B976FFF|nr:hypothetical protein [Rhodopirellula sp. MGV]OYP35833.1 hypothetical protein CGZ80_10580 [Rhodopirellula sp. MGV]PNY36354.1 hypothetical protein C2E31_13030 [Rhodopirellula baltica]
MPDSINPFAPPPEIETPLEKRFQDESDPLQSGSWFNSDWSRDGLKSRMVDDRKQVYFVWLMVTACLSAGLAALFQPSLFVLILPAAFALAVTWIANIGLWDDRRFWRRYPAFAQPVEGRITKRSIFVRSRHCVLAALLNQSQAKFDDRSNTLRLLLPFATESVRLVASDFTRVLSDSESLDSEVPLELIRQGLRSSETIDVTFRLRDNDLNDRPRQFKRWSAVALIQLVWTLLVFGQFFPLAWLNTGNTASLIRFPATWIVVYGIGVLLIFACFYSIMRADLGEFRCSVASDCVILSRAAYQSCYGYTNEALRHFRWTTAGLEVRLRQGRLLMLVPRNSFKRSDHDRLAVWFDKELEPPDEDYFIGPLL